MTPKYRRANKTYISGKSRLGYDREDDEGEPPKRGRGTAKDAVLGAITRDVSLNSRKTSKQKQSTSLSRSL